MIEVYKNSKIYVLCPAYVKTGGPELLHQLVNKLHNRNIDAYIVYMGIEKDNPNYIADDFKSYNVKYIFEEQIEDKMENILIIPETLMKKVNDFKKIRKVIWWLSVDNYKKNFMFIPALKLCGLKYAVKLLINGTIIFHKKDYKKAEYNLCQSYYAIDYLKQRNVPNIIYLSDYINKAFMDENKEIRKLDNVLYNPKKGYKFTKKIIQKSPNLNWIPIKGLTMKQVKNLLLESKVYIDFGNHPGKDRFPREAAMCNCCVITGKRGAAKYYEDVGISDEFKFDDINRNILKIVKKINECIDNYDFQSKKFLEYRKYIKSEEEKFEKDIDKIFVKKGD